MPNFLYEAVDKNGKKVEGKIEAENLARAIAKINKFGLYPTKVSAEDEHVTPKTKWKDIILRYVTKRPRMSIKQLALFTRELAVLLKSGIPLVKSLYILSGQVQFENRKEMIIALAKGLEDGNSFSEMLAGDEGDFSRVYTNMVLAGERSGALEVILERLAIFLEKNIWLANRIKIAMIYPIIVMAAAIAVIFFLILFVVPKFVGLFADMGTALPFITMSLLMFADFIKNFWYLFLLGLFGISYGYILLQKNTRCRFFFDRMKLKVPVFGSLSQKVAVSRISRTLATLLSGGVPILQALVITGDICGNTVISQAIQRAHDSVKEGEPLSRPLFQQDVFPSLAVNMIKVGEESGSLDAMLERVANVYDDEIDSTVTALTSIIEPLLIAVMGIVVLFIVAALFLPLITLVKTLSI
ncbi:MAG: type II secretion system F family protein [Candidatus Omnitrophota bacterium]